MAFRMPASRSRARRRATPLAAVLLLPLLAAARCGGSELDPPRGDLRVLVVSDLNSSYGSTTYEPTVAHAARLAREVWKPDLVLAAGDLIAGQRPTLSDANVRAMWTAFDSVVRRPLRAAGIPFGFALGNHDASAAPAHRRDRALAAAFWRDAAHATGLAFVDSAGYPLNYSFRQGDAFFLVWDASHAGTARDTALVRWVGEALASDVARQAKLRFVVGHLPLYAVAEGRNRAGEVLDEPDSLRALLERHAVHTYVSGHHHAYYPGRRGRLELLHAGALGQGARPLLGQAQPSPQTVTLLDVFFARDSVAYTTFAYQPGGAPALRRLEPGELPPRLRGLTGYVVRRDLPDTVAPAPVRP